MAVRIVVDAEKCTGCMSCVLRCSLKKTGKFLPKKACLKIIRQEATADYRPLTCNNCPSQRCLEACDYDALSIDPQLMIPRIDDQLCIACGRCIEECEFGIINFSEDERSVYKCDLCGGKPACVEVCVPGSITIEEQE